MHGFTVVLQVKFSEMKNMGIFRDTSQAENWMTKQEAFLANDDLGDSLDSVESLLKKHEDFEKSLTAQEEKINALNEFATKLIEGHHYDAEDVVRFSIKIFSIDRFNFRHVDVNRC